MYLRREAQVRVQTPAVQEFFLVPFRSTGSRPDVPERGEDEVGSPHSPVAAAFLDELANLAGEGPRTVLLSFGRRSSMNQGVTDAMGV